MVNLAQKEKDIDGVIFTPLKIISVADGDILHGMKISEEGYQGFGEAYFSSVHHNSIKGWKRHFKMVLNMVVPIGKIRFVLFDDRKESTTFGYFQEIIMSEDNYGRLTVPPMIWFGFQGVGKGRNLLLNISNIPHDAKEQENKALDSITYNWNMDR